MENKKFYVGKYTEGYESSKGWFVGSYLRDDQAKTDQIEIRYYSHLAGEIGALHRHDKKIEVGIVIEGKLEITIEGQLFTIGKGDFYFLEKGVAGSSKYIEPTKILAIHSPCVPSDKVVL